MSDRRGGANKQQKRGLDRVHKRARKADMVLTAALEAAAENRRPDVSASDDLDVVAIVDPNEAEALVRVGRGPPMRVANGKPQPRLRIVSLRDDPVGQMAKRGQLGQGTDGELRLSAARRWQSLYERSEIGGARGIDPTRDVVDGGRFEMPDTDARIRAQDELANVRRALGANGDKLVTWVLGLKFTLAKIAMMLGAATRMDQIVIGHRFRECLDTIADVSGMLSDKTGPRRLRDDFDTIAPYATNPELHRAVHRAKFTNDCKR